MHRARVRNSLQDLTMTCTNTEAGSTVSTAPVRCAPECCDCGLRIAHAGKGGSSSDQCAVEAEGLRDSSERSGCDDALAEILRDTRSSWRRRKIAKVDRKSTRL